jgi:3D (Asp-Asp-Asp) domain-containing protein
MKVVTFVVFVALASFGFSVNEFAEAPELSPVLAALEWPLPTPLPPSPQARTNLLLHAFGIGNLEAPEPPPGYRYWGTVVAKVTAYEPSAVSCGSSADGKTSTLRSAWRMDGCAVAPEAIPYGTLVWIPGIGWRLADDTGSAMKRSWKKGMYHIDVRMGTVSQCRRWGNQDLVPVMLCLPE